MLHSFKKRLLNLFQAKANPAPAGYPSVTFQKIFQLYSPLYAPFEPGSMPESSPDNPLAIVKGIAEGILPDLAKVFENPHTQVEDVQYLRTKHDDWIVYGECSTPDPQGKERPNKRLFMMMFSNLQVEYEGQMETHFAPYFLFDATYASGANKLLLLPQNICTFLKADTLDLQMYEHDFPAGFGKVLCYADAVFGQTLAAHKKVDFAACQKWIDTYPDFMHEQKIKYIEQRDINQLCTEIKGYREHEPQPV